MPAYKLGRWDGTVSFLGLGGTTYVSMLKEVIEELENKGVYIEVEDHRNKIDPHSLMKLQKTFYLILNGPKGHNSMKDKQYNYVIIKQK